MLVKQVRDAGVHEFMSKILNSYTKYYNTKHNRVGPLLQGQFKAVLVETDEQLIHLSRYIHLNPLVSGLTTNLDDFDHSSYPSFVRKKDNDFCFTSPILDFFNSPGAYREFVLDNESYGAELHRIKQLLLEEI